jgi:GntR family transcriptional regulator/MocR family aminotransferase
MKLDNTLERPLWLQIVDTIVCRVDHGHLAPGEQLLPSRVLAQELGISRSTVQLAYDELVARGYVITARRGGTRIIASSQTRLTSTSNNKDHIALPFSPEFEEADEQMSAWMNINQKQSVEIDFRHQEPYIDDTFQNTWRRACARALRNMDNSLWGYGDSRGVIQTRTEIQHYLSTIRGIHVEENQILLTCGTQQALDLIAQGLLQKGEKVAVEDPGFPGARLNLTYRGMRVTGIPIDEHGIIVEAIPSDVRLVCVTPAHQRPTGVVMSAQRRQQLLDFSLENQCWIIEDEFDGEYRYRGGPLPTLFSDHCSNVIYILTFSKVLSPGIRLAAVVASANVIERLSKIQSMIQRQPPIMEQLTLSEFFKLGDFTRHIRRMRILYGNRQRSLMKVLSASSLTQMFRIQGTDTGLHVMLEAFDVNFSERDIVEAAFVQGVRVYPMKPYCFTSNRKGVLLGFAQIDAIQIREGIHRLERVL